MKTGIWAGLLLATLIVAGVIGCGDFWQAPGGSSGGGGTTSTCTAAPTPSTTVTASTSSSGNFYILNSTSIAGYYINAGTLTPLSGSPWALPTGSTPFAMAIDPVNGNFLFVSTNIGIYLYEISGGAPTLQSSTPVIADVTAYALKVDPSGQWLLDASNTASAPTLNAYPINSSTGASTLGSNPAPSVVLVSGGSISQGGIAVSADNNLVAVAVGSETEVFNFTKGSGYTSGTNPFSTGQKIAVKGTSAISVAFSPTTSFLYIGETGNFSCSTNSGGLRIIPIASDALGTEPAASPYPSGGTGPHSILPLSSGYVYVANWQGSGSGNITGFLVGGSATAPTLTVQSTTVPTGTQPEALAEDSTGPFVLAVSSGGSPVFDAYTFDTTTAGQLDTALTSTTTGTGPIAIVAAP